MGVFPAKSKHIVYRYGHVENMTAHAVGSGSIKTVGTKESSRGVCGQHLSIKEHADHIRIPCAIDPKIRAVAKERYQQAVALARNYGASKVIIHGGYNERLYFPCWFVEQSILFWKDFLTEVPEVEIVLENVLEPKPEMLVEILEAVNHPNLKMCLDIGHANAYSSIPLQDWLNTCGPYISHFHIHNNDGTQDAHSPLTEGTIHMRSFLMNAQSTCPNATFTLELMDAEASVQWLVKEKIIEMPELVSKGDTL